MTHLRTAELMLKLKRRSIGVALISIVLLFYQLDTVDCLTQSSSISTSYCLSSWKESVVCIGLISFDVTLSCPKNSGDLLCDEYNWELNGAEVTGRHGEVLLLKNLSVKDKGVYTCKCNALSAGFVLKVDSPVPVNFSEAVYNIDGMLYFSPRRFELGSVVHTCVQCIYCNATGFPQPLITWSFKSWLTEQVIAIQNSSEIFQIPAGNHGQVLCFDALQDIDFYSGIYTCKAENILGSVRVNRIVEIDLGEPEPRPSIHQTIKNLTLDQTGTATLQCSSTDAYRTESFSRICYRPFHSDLPSQQHCCVCSRHSSCRDNITITGFKDYADGTYSCLATIHTPGIYTCEFFTSNFLCYLEVGYPISVHSYDGPHNNTSDSQRDFLIIYLVNGGMVLLVLLGLSILVILVLCFKLKQQKDHNNTEMQPLVNPKYNQPNFEVLHVLEDLKK